MKIIEEIEIIPGYNANNNPKLITLNILNLEPSQTGLASYGSSISQSLLCFHPLMSRNFEQSKKVPKTEK